MPATLLFLNEAVDYLSHIMRKPDFSQYVKCFQTKRRSSFYSHTHNGNIILPDLRWDFTRPFMIGLLCSIFVCFSKQLRSCLVLPSQEPFLFEHETLSEKIPTKNSSENGNRREEPS